MAEELILQEQNGPVLIWTLNRPKALNALNSEILRALDARMTTFRNEGTARVIVLRGSGDRAFAAGADVKQMLDMGGFEGSDFAREGQQIMRRMSDLPVPVVAAVHGFCLGGGFELALSCDTIWASETARFGFPEVSIGLLPGFAGTQRLVRATGINVAQDLILSARNIKAPEALSIGAVSRVLPEEDFFAAVQHAAEAMAINAPRAQALAKQLVLSATETDLENGSRAEASAFGLALASADAKEGISALLEKRAANFKGC